MLQSITAWRAMLDAAALCVCCLGVHPDTRCLRAILKLAPPSHTVCISHFKWVRLRRRSLKFKKAAATLCLLCCQSILVSGVFWTLGQRCFLRDGRACKRGSAPTQLAIPASFGTTRGSLHRAKTFVRCARPFHAASIWSSGSQRVETHVDHLHFVDRLGASLSSQGGRRPRSYQSY